MSEFPPGERLAIWGIHQVDINWDEIRVDARESVNVLTNYVITTICALVEHENDVRLKVQANHRRAMFTVCVHDDDVGLAVGTGGRHADALRVLLIAACRKLGFRFDLDIVGASGGRGWSST